MISPTKTSPFSLRSGDSRPAALISTQKYEWYMHNALNTTPTVLAYDTGSLGAKLDISNPALTNKPTASTIGTKISYVSDGVDDYLYKSENDFMRSLPTWMVTAVFKYNSSDQNWFLSCLNEANTTNSEGFFFWYNPSSKFFLVSSFNSAGTSISTPSTLQTLTNGQNYIITYGWNGTNVVFYLETTLVGSIAVSNPLLRPSTTSNIATAFIRNTSFFKPSNIGYIGVDEFDLTKLTNNVATLKTTFGI